MLIIQIRFIEIRLIQTNKLSLSRNHFFTDNIIKIPIRRRETKVVVNDTLAMT